MKITAKQQTTRYKNAMTPTCQWRKEKWNSARTARSRFNEEWPILQNVNATQLGTLSRLLNIAQLIWPMVMSHEYVIHFLPYNFLIGISASICMFPIPLDTSQPCNTRYITSHTCSRSLQCFIALLQLLRSPIRLPPESYHIHWLMLLLVLRAVVTLAQDAWGGQGGGVLGTPEGPILSNF